MVVVMVVVVVVVCGRRFVEQFGFSRISRRSFLPSDRLPICHLLSSKIFGVSLSFAGAVRFSLFPLAFLLDSVSRQQQEELAARGLLADLLAVVRWNSEGKATGAFCAHTPPSSLLPTTPPSTISRERNGKDTWPYLMQT